MEQDSSYYFLFDYRGNVQGNFSFKIFNCENSCPPVAAIQITDTGLTSVGLSWNEPISDANYFLKYEPQHYLQTPIEIPDHPDTFITITGLDEVAPYEVQIRTLCPDGTMSVWTTAEILTGDNPRLEEGEVTRCNPRFIPAGIPATTGLSYEMMSLQVPQDGAYFLASDFPMLPRS